MIKKQQKWIALLVVFTFMWLLQVSTLPLAAAGTTEQVSSANSEQGPRFIEEEGSSGYHAPKKSILPVVLIGVGVVALAAVLILVVFKTSYDIRGTWTVTVTWTGYSPGTFPIVFSGEKNAGTLLDDGYWTGTYAVDGKKLTWEYDYDATVFNGTFTGKDSMEGTMTYPPSDTGTFTAVRTAASTAGTGNTALGGKTKKIR